MRSLALSTALLCAACASATSGLDLHFRADLRAWDALASRIAGSPRAPSPPPTLIAVTAGSPAQLIAYEADGTARWQTPTDAASPWVATAHVVLSTDAENDRLVARELARGQRVFESPLHGLSLLGAASDDETLVFVTATPSIRAEGARSVISAVDWRRGQLRWERVLTAAVGAPVLRGGVVLVPWNRQGIAAIDLRNGHEVGRFERAALNVEWIDDSDVVTRGTGSVSALHCARQGQECPSLRSPYGEAPSDPALHVSSYRLPRRNAISSAWHITRTPAGELRWSGDRAYLAFYRYVFAFAPDGALVWVHVLDHDVVHVSASERGVLAVSSDGAARFLRAQDGSANAWLTLSTPLQSAMWLGALPAFDDSAWKGALPLHQGLVQVIGDHDNRLVVARAFAVQQLARDPDPQVTGELLAAYEDRATPAGLQQVIAAALRERRTGKEHLIAALARHRDFLTGVSPPPLPVVVPALITMEAQEAAGALLDHVEDPATSDDDLLVLGDGLAHLGAASLAPRLAHWLARYRASDAFSGRPDVVMAMASTVVALDPGAAQPLRDAAALSDTHPTFAAALHGALRPAAETAEPPATPAPAVAELPARPKQLSQRDVDAAFTAQIESMRACVVSELSFAPTLTAVRILFVSRPDGTTHSFSVTPASPTLTTCLMPVLDNVRVRPFDARAQVASYVIRLRKSAPPISDDAAPAPSSAIEWWMAYAREAPPTEGAPWWARYATSDTEWVPQGPDPSPSVVHGTAAPDASLAAPTGRDVAPVSPSATQATTSPADAATPDAPSPTEPGSWWLPTQP